MAGKFGRYDADLVAKLQLTKAMLNKPRGANNNKDGRAFELAHGAYILLREMHSVLEAGITCPVPFEQLRRYYFNDRPICMVDDFELVGTSGRSCSQLKVGAIRWKQLLQDFRDQIKLDGEQGLYTSYHLVIGSQRNLSRVRARLARENLPQVIVDQHLFPPTFFLKLKENPELGHFLETISGTDFIQHWESIHQSVLCRFEETRSEVPLFMFVRFLHEKDPHLFHPLEELHHYDYLLDILHDCAPDVVCTVRGPTLWLEQATAREVFTVPWGMEDLVADFEHCLEAFDQSDAEHFLNLADLARMLVACGWNRAMPRKRSRRYIDEGGE